MFSIGDTVVFTRDGTMGIITRIKDNQCQVIWEDHFVSWENELSLQKAENPVESRHLQPQFVQAKEKKIESV